MNNQFGVCWREWSRNENTGLIMRHRLFNTDAQREREAKRISDGDRFYEFVMWFEKETLQ